MSKHTCKRYFDSSGNLLIKPYRLKDLQSIYDLDYRTFLRMIQPYQSEIGDKIGNYYTIHQVCMIIEKIGKPGVAK